MIKSAILAASLFLASPALPADLLSVMSRYEGMHEVRDRAALKRMLGINPSSTPWCGYMLTYVVEKAGGKPPAGSARAASWKSYGRPVSRSKAKIGRAIAVVRGGQHAGVYAGTDKRGRTCVKSGNTTNRVGTACFAGRAWVRQ